MTPKLFKVRSLQIFQRESQRNLANEIHVTLHWLAFLRYSKNCEVFEILQLLNKIPNFPPLMHSAGSSPPRVTYRETLLLERNRNIKVCCRRLPLNREKSSSSADAARWQLNIFFQILTNI